MKEAQNAGNVKKQLRGIVGEKLYLVSYGQTSRGKTQEFALKRDAVRFAKNNKYANVYVLYSSLKDGVFTKTSVADILDEVSELAIQ
ncbi:MAG: hypothetical protein LBC87_07270 [Fibromonadaceae bacterium]|jgi:Neuraminidase (sialidase)|nr:hypothetical protein [Fibromonadaceae bacterium]